MPRVTGRLRPENWPQIRDEETGETRPLTAQELLDAGVVVVGRTPSGIAAVDCAAPDARRRERLAALGVEVLSEGLSDSRWAQMPAGEEKRACHRARVIRARDGSDLRGSCNAAVQRALEARVPALANRSAAPADPEGARAVLEEARRRARDEAEQADVELLLVPMSDVRDTDVVEEDGIRPHRWLGEAED